MRAACEEHASETEVWAARESELTALLQEQERAVSSMEASHSDESAAQQRTGRSRLRACCLGLGLSKSCHELSHTCSQCAQRIIVVCRHASPKLHELFYAGMVNMRKHRAQIATISLDEGTNGFEGLPPFRWGPA